MAKTDRRLSENSEQRFLDLYGHLLVYVNDRFDVIEEIETVADLEQFYTDDLLPLRNTLYNESTTDLIEDFVEENPAELSEADFDQAAAWTDFVTGEFVVVRYRENDAVFLDVTEPPKAYAVRPPGFRSPNSGMNPHCQSRSRVSLCYHSRTRSSTTDGSASRTSSSEGRSVRTLTTNTRKPNTGSA
jgi:hypothetical protein